MTVFAIVAVPANLVDYVWEDCLPWVHKVTDQVNGDLTPDGIKRRLTSGDNLLALTMKDGVEIVGVNVMEIGVLDSGDRIMYVPVTAGTYLDDWMEDFYTFAKLAGKEHGCTEIRGMVLRESWLRKMRRYGFERVFTVIKTKV